MGWEEHLVQASANAPEDVAQKLATCIDREVLLMALLRRRDDPSQGGFPDTEEIAQAVGEVDEPLFFTSAVCTSPPL
jgi:hypothetical protein